MTVALDDAEEVLLDRALDAQRRRGIHFEVLEPEEARGREPALPASLQAAFSFPRDGVARAGRVGRALVLAARAAGVRVHEGNARAGGAPSRPGGSPGVETTAGPPPGRGRRSRGPGGAGPGRRCAAPPARRRPSGRGCGWTRRPIPTGRRASSSRGESPSSPVATARSSPWDGRSRAHRAASPGAGSVAALLSEVQRLVPASSGWALVEAGAGRELSAPDRLPVLGETAIPGLFVAAGWGADELLLAPAAAARRGGPRHGADAAPGRGAVLSGPNRGLTGTEWYSARLYVRGGGRLLGGAPRCRSSWRTRDDA